MGFLFYHQYEIILGGILLFITIHAIVRFGQAKKAATPFPYLKNITLYAFLIYCFGVYSYTLSSFILPTDLRFLPQSSINIIPGSVFIDYFNLIKQNAAIFLPIALFNIFGNILMFVPLGCFTMLYLYWHPKKKPLLKSFLFFAGCSLAIEVLQYLFSSLGMMMARATDIDDVILNTIGGLLGYALTKLFFIVLAKIKKNNPTANENSSPTSSD